MAHFAEIDENNIVIRILVVPDDQEHRGQEFLAEDLGLGGTWLKTSYNTSESEHLLGGTPYRLNYATIGGYYDPELDGFIPVKPFPSYVLDSEKARWVSPVPKPEDTEDAVFIWDETIVNWRALPI